MAFPPVPFQEWFLRQTSTGNAALNAYVARVKADGGVVEAIGCVPLAVWDWVAPVVPTYGPEVTAWIARLNTEGFTLPSAANLSLLDTFVSALKSAGAWTGLDLLEIWAQDSNSVNAGRVNFKNPSATVGTIYNAVTFTNKVGITGDGVSAYVDTGYNPADNGVNFTQNDASFGAFVVDRGTSDYLLGLIDSDNTRYRPRTITNQRLNTASNISFATAQQEGFSGIHRTSSSNVNNLQTDGTIGANVASTSTAPLSADGNLSIFRSRINYSNGAVGVVYAGASFTSGEWLAFRNAVVTYINAVAAL